MLPLTMAMLALFSCTKEQTTLTIEDIPGKATVTGCITYTTGQKYEGGQFKENFAPAANTTVQVKVLNSTLDPNSSATGYTVYTATTDEKGNYTAEVPALDRGSVTVVVKAPSFTGVRTYVEKMEKGNPVIKEMDVVYNAASQTVTVETGDIKVCDIMYGYTERGTAETFEDVETLYGKIGISQFYQKSYQDFERDDIGRIIWTDASGNLYYGGYYENNDNAYTSNLNRGYTPKRKTRYESIPYWAEKNGINVLVTVTYPSDYSEIKNGSVVAMTRTFGATTDKEGKFEIKVPVREKGITLSNVTVKPESYREKSFVNYYQTITSSYYKDYSNSEFLDGIYEANSSDVNYGRYTFSTIEGVYDEISVRMIFDPLSDQDVSNFKPTVFNSCDKWGIDSVK